MINSSSVSVDGERPLTTTRYGFSDFNPYVCVFEIGNSFSKCIFYFGGYQDVAIVQCLEENIIFPEHIVNKTAEFLIVVNSTYCVTLGGSLTVDCAFSDC